MSGIHNLILNKVQSELEAALITAIPEGDPSRVGAVKIGDLQGDPDPDVARISVTLYYNDPDQTISGSGLGNNPDPWDDTVEEIECGAAITWKRRFTAKIRCLFESTGEDLMAAHQIASDVRSRTEKNAPADALECIFRRRICLARRPLREHPRSGRAGGRTPGCVRLPYQNPV